MKKLCLTVLAAGMTTVSFCQKTFILSHQDKKGFFAISAGASLPMGQFGSCSPADNQASMAGHGLAVNISAGYRFVGRVGLMIKGEQHRNALQTDALLATVYRSNNDVWTAKADNWSVTTVMGGPYINIPFGRFSVDARVLAGRARAVLPSTSIVGNFGNVDMSVQTTGSESMATAFGGGLSLNYRLGRSISVKLNGDYTQALFTFDNLISKARSTNGQSESSHYSTDRTVGVVSASAGVVLLFGNSHRPF
jgi:hypothetical protein